MVHLIEKTHCCSATLRGSNVSDGDMLELRRVGNAAPPQSRAQGAEFQQVLTRIQQNPQLLNQLPQSVRNRVLSNDVSVVQEILRYGPLASQRGIPLMSYLVKHV